MKPAILFITLSLAFMSVAPLTQAQPNAPHAFVIELVGALTFADVEAIRAGLGRSPPASTIHVARSARGVVDLAGSWSGSVEQLRTDLAALAADRFTIEGEGDRRNGMSLTLRKLPPPPPAEKQ